MPSSRCSAQTCHLKCSLITVPDRYLEQGSTGPSHNRHSCSPSSARDGFGLQATFVRSHFVKIVSGEGRVGLPELPQDVIESLLSSEELETQSEDDILEVKD